MKLAISLATDRGRIGILGEAQDGYTKELMAAIPRFAAGILETISRDE